MSVDINKINPYIRRAMPSVISAGTEIAQRVIFDYELIFIEKGGFTLGFAETDYKCTSGDFIFLRPGIPHSLKNINCDLFQPHIHFDLVYTENSTKIPISFKDFPQFTAEERCFMQKDLFYNYPKTPFVYFKEKERLLDLFYGITNDRYPNNSLIKKARLTEIIDMLINDNFPESFSSDANRQYTVSQQLKDFIDAGQGVTLSLDQLEKQFSYSKYYMERKFKEAYGISLIAYRNSKKMELAKKLLKTQSVSATAEQLGFSSIYSFSRAFKKYFGICPTQSEKISH